MQQRGSAIFEMLRPSVLSTKDILVAPGSTDAESMLRTVNSQDFTAYYRAALAFTLVITNSRSLASNYVWTVPHLLSVSQILADSTFLGLQVSASANDTIAFAGILDRASAHIMAQVTKRCTTSWHDSCVASLRKGSADKDPLIAIMLASIGGSKTAPSGIMPRVLAQTAKLLVRYSDMEVPQAERWFALAQSWQTSSQYSVPVSVCPLIHIDADHCTDPAACMALFVAIAPVMADSPKLQRYQSELANDLSGIRLHDVAAKGIPLLRLFVLLASIERDTELLPTNRAMFLVQASQAWLLNEDDEVELPEETHTLLLRLFTSLVVTVEAVAGSHWEVWSDLCESIIEVSGNL